MTVVVVQSGDLAAWVGAASGLAGVVLGAGIDAWRRRQADRKQLRKDLDAAAGDLIVASAAVADARRAVADHPSDPAWQQILDARQAAVAEALRTITKANSEAMTQAAIDIMSIAMSNGLPSGAQGRDAMMAQIDELGVPVRAFNDALRRAKL